ncbi:MAG: PDDEXK nuclease domain-containing protein [Coriobacteriales bacterium]|jgi:predicted nuclease of restriction endonuclease-like (RecB) superfamily|nr:PDDEXK nuclease domain-containing protein [Coriobacteriales bacterium]
MSNGLGRDSSYKDWLKELKQRIRRSQAKAVIHVNAELLELYWSIGFDIVSKQESEGWGSAVIPQLSLDLREEFPEVQGFSERNLRDMRRFYLSYTQLGVIRQLPVAELGSGAGQHPSTPAGASRGLHANSLCPTITAIPWRHHMAIVAQAKSSGEALFYINKTIEEGWSRTVLVNNLRSDLYSRQGKAPSNFTRLLPCPQSDLAQEIIKDPYNFDFITLAKKHRERELQDALTDNLSRLMLELGQGFAYVGKRVNLVVGSKELEIDVLFYHLRLHCYVVVELKVEEFEASFMGQLGTYVSAVDGLLRADVDNPTIGLLICKTKDNVYAEYALKSSSKPIGVSTYEITELLPEDVRPSLPTIEEIEAALSDEE